MKISKKVLGIAMAIIMIFNVFAIGTFAAFPDDTVVKLAVSTDKATYAPGDEIVLKISEQCISEVGTMQIAGQYEFAYNNAVLEPYASTIALDDHGMSAIQAGYDASISVVQLPGNATDPSALYDWNSTICFCLASDGTTFAATDMTELFTVKMKVKADAPDGTYTIGFNPNGYEMYNAYSVDGLGFGGLYGVDASAFGFSVPNMYEYGTYTFTVSSAPAVEVTHVGEQAKWKGGNANNTAENYLFGFLGQATGLTVETTEENGHNVVTNIKDIIATANYNGTTVTSEVITMWEVDGGYQFRAVFKGFDPADTKDVSVTFAITMSDGTTVYTTADASVDTPNAIYLAAVERGMPALAA